MEQVVRAIGNRTSVLVHLLGSAKIRLLGWLPPLNHILSAEKDYRKCGLNADVCSADVSRSVRCHRYISSMPASLLRKNSLRR